MLSAKNGPPDPPRPLGPNEFRSLVHVYLSLPQAVARSPWCARCGAHAFAFGALIACGWELAAAATSALLANTRAPRPARLVSAGCVALWATISPAAIHGRTV